MHGRLWQAIPISLLSCGLLHAAEPAVVTAASSSVADIQTAVRALDGPGTVRIPAGTVEAVGTIEIPGGVNLIGAGSDATRLGRGGQTEARSTRPIISVRGTNGLPVRISGLALIGMEDPTSDSCDSGITIVDTVDFRIDNCLIRRFGMGGVNVRGRTRGVIDSCRLVDNFKKPINNVGYGVVVYGPGDWLPDLRPGSRDAVYIEDCEFIGSRHAVASNAGARYVFRHNHVHGNDNSQAVDAHGPGYGSRRGTQWIEVYNNIIEKPVGGSTAMLIRGGDGVVFGNTMRDYRTGIMLTLDFDRNLDWSGPYPLPDQIRNIWCWDNTLDGNPVRPTVPSRSANHIKLGRDYHESAMPNYRPYTYPHPLRED